MITSKLRTHSRTTIPSTVRIALDLNVGDDIAYEIERGRVILTKALPATSESPFTSFNEWNTDEDRRAYESL